MNALLRGVFYAGLLAIAAVLSGCAGAMSDVTVPIEPVNRIESSQERFRPVVEVVDLRRESTMRRTTIGEVSLGAIILSPPDAELVGELVANAAVRAGAKNPTKIYCGIRVFDVATPATALYWDVSARIELVLRVHGHDRSVEGQAVERTAVWPSGEIIGRVTTQALRQVASAAEKELPSLLATSP